MVCLRKKIRMNKASFLYLLVFLTVVACDNSSNVEPASDSYFLKFYGQTGYQEGVDVKETSDGGFVIAGNSIRTFGGQSDYLLIKVDARGNQVWQQTYDFGGEDRMTEVVVANNEYYIAGTSTVSNTNKIMLVHVDANGAEIDNYVVVSSDLTYNYICTGLTYSSSGNFIVVGSTDSPAGGSPAENSIMAIIDNNWTGEEIKYSGISGQPVTYVKAYEILDTQTQKPAYLAFGYKEENGGFQMGLDQYDELLNSPNSNNYITASDAKTIDVILDEEGSYLMIGAANDLSVIVSVNSAPVSGYDKYFVNTGYEIGFTRLLANGVAKIKEGEFAVSGNLLVENSDITKATIFNSNSNGSIDWIRQFGTTSSYSAGKVRVISDGSIVFTGTAELESQTKAFLVKMRNNGEMK